MFKFINKRIEKAIRSKLHKKKQHYIEKTLKSFSEEHSIEETEELKKRLLLESIRLYEIVDKSIIRDRVRRGWYTFVGTAILGTIVAAATFVGTHGSSLLFITPLTGAFATWALSLVTIPTSYNQRVQGGFNGVNEGYKRELSTKRKIPLKEEYQPPAKQIKIEEKQIKEVNQPEPIAEKPTLKANFNSGNRGRIKN